MKNTILLVFALFTLQNSYSQTPVYQWAKSAGGTSNDMVQGITSDASGNIYVIGGFESPSITFGSFTLYNNGTNNVFIVKYDSTGNVIWAKSAGGTDDDEGYSITTDATGNIYVTGYFESPNITFGSDTLNNNNDYHADVFIVKYDPNGNVIWDRSAGETYYDYGQSITSDASGNIYVTGSFASSGITFGSDTLNSNGYFDVFIVKLSEYPNTIENTFGSNFKFYPNPVNDYLYIELDKAYKNISVSVHNITGQVIMHKNFKNQDKLKLHIKGVGGIYFISLQTDTNEKAVFKVLKD